MDEKIFALFGTVIAAIALGWATIWKQNRLDHDGTIAQFKQQATALWEENARLRGQGILDAGTIGALKAENFNLKAENDRLRGDKKP